MSESDAPQVITRSARSVAASKRWDKKRQESKEPEKEAPMSERRFDWHLAISAISIIVTLGSIIFGCYFSLRRDIGDLSKEIVKIETVLILKGVAPPELFANNEVDK
jgi:hypothetical protein